MNRLEKKYIFWAPDDWLVFPDTLNHRAVAHAHNPRGTPLSAGFVRQSPDGNVELYGESPSLGLMASKDHERMINALFGKGTRREQ